MHISIFPKALKGPSNIIRQTQFLFVWLFFKAVGLAFKAAWGTAKIIASILFAIAVHMLVRKK